MKEELKIKKPEMKKGEEKEISAAEKENLPTIFLIYRDNNSFKEWSSEIVKNLKSFGRKVEIQIFPVGTNTKEIAEWIEKNKQNLKDKEILPDATCGGALMNAQMNAQDTNTRFEGARDSCYLDKLLGNVTEKAILGDKYEAVIVGGSKDMGMAEKAFITLIKLILENKDNLPKKVYISLKNIFDHAPFYDAFRKRIEEERNDLIIQKGILPDENGEFPYKKIPEEYLGYKGSEELRRMAGENIKEWLVKGGIPLDKIMIMSDKETDGLVFEKEADSPGNWIIIDRHSFETKTFDAKRLELPLSNFFQGALRENLIQKKDLKPDELSGLIKKKLERDFDIKTKEEE